MKIIYYLFGFFFWQIIQKYIHMCEIMERKHIISDQSRPPYIKCSILHSIGAVVAVIVW